MERKYRLDKYLVKIGLFPSREKAKEAIKNGEVYVNGKLITKGGMYIRENSKIEVMSPKIYVSRAGEKLREAILFFNIEIQNKIALDIGAGTGGFTEVLLENGINRVYAVDVGRGVIHKRIRENPRVIVMEGVNARYLSKKDIPEGIDIITEDTSFISSKLIIPNVKVFLKSGGDYILLVKPQFEGGKSSTKKGVVKDFSIHKEILIDTLNFVKEEGFYPIGIIPSPVRGKEGNIEYLLYMKKEEIDIDLPLSEIAEDAIKKAKEKFYEDRNLL